MEFFFKKMLSIHLFYLFLLLQVQAIDLSRFNLGLDTAVSDGKIIFTQATDNHFLIWIDMTIHVFDAQVTKKVNTFVVNLPAPQDDGMIDTNNGNTHLDSVGNKVYYVYHDYNANYGKIYEIDFLANKVSSFGYDRFLTDHMVLVHPILRVSNDKKFLYYGYSVDKGQGIIESRIRKYDLKTKDEIKSYIFAPKTSQENRILVQYEIHGDTILVSTIRLAPPTSRDLLVGPSQILSLNLNLEEPKKVLEVPDYIGLQMQISKSNLYYIWATEKSPSFSMTQNQILVNQNQDISLRKLNEFPMRNLRGDKDRNHLALYWFASDKNALYMSRLDNTVYLWKSVNWNNPKPQLRETFNYNYGVFWTMTPDKQFVWILNGNDLKKWWL